jgi:hypothetical protein
MKAKGEWKMRRIRKIFMLQMVFLLIPAMMMGCNSPKDYKDTPISPVMDEDEFWNVIAMLDWKYEGDDEKVAERATNYLARRSDEDIYRFYDILSKRLYDLDGVAYAKNIGEDSFQDNGTYFSPDWFLYARCAVIANGRDYYGKVLGNPEEMPKDAEFEWLLYLADEAFEKKNGEELDHIAEYDFETFSNKAQWVQE